MNKWLLYVLVWVRQKQTLKKGLECRQVITGDADKVTQGMRQGRQPIRRVLSSQVGIWVFILLGSSRKQCKTQTSELFHPNGEEAGVVIYYQPWWKYTPTCVNSSVLLLCLCREGCGLGEKPLSIKCSHWLQHSELPRLWAAWQPLLQLASSTPH